MKEILLFTGKNGSVTNKDLFEALQKLGAQNADVLYIHTALKFGTPNLLIPKKQLLFEILEVIKSLNVSTLIFPTYTFSFCNGNIFDVQNSKTPMGLLNDFVRSQEGAIRSIDPLMSNVLIGKHKEFVTNIGNSSIGDNSTFDLIHRTSLNVKFLFLGPSIGDCYTYMHYIEERVNAPYRYNKCFKGIITDKGHSYEDSFDLFVRYSNAFPGAGSYIYENILIEREEAKRIALGDGLITITDEKKSFDT
jgi:aminoglycoside 3-N-acetyltransferase